MAIFETNFIKNITSVSEPFPHGQRISYAVIEYNREILNESLTPDCFQIGNRTITRIYANTEPEKAAEGKNGKYVIAELSLYDADAPLFITVRDGGIGVTSGQDNKPFTGHGPGPGPRGPGGPGRGGPLKLPKVVVAENRLTVRQCGELTAADGTKIPAFNGELASKDGVNKVIDDFRIFRDAEIPYSLYIPKNYDPAQKYPMVVFVADASVKGDDPRLALVQGNGAVSFALPEQQEKHPSFVLAPQIPSFMEPRSNNSGGLPEILMSLVEKVCSEYAVDRSRIYTTGQSLGCINAFACAAAFPHSFAAYLCVGGQWEDTASLRHMKDDNVWMLNSDGDARAYPGMNAIAEELRDAGADIERGEYDAKWPKEQLEAAAEATAASGRHVLYSTFIDQSVVPEGVTKSPVSNHMNTWPVAYSLNAVHDWLFRQKKAE